MRKPVAKPTSPRATQKPETDRGSTTSAPRAPMAFAPALVTPENQALETWQEAQQDTQDETKAQPNPPVKNTNWALRFLWITGSLLISLALALAFERLIGDLFQRFEWLGWVGSGLLTVFVVAILALLLREILALRRLNVLDGLRNEARQVLKSNLPAPAKALIARLNHLYFPRADLARARQKLDIDLKDQFDGADMIKLAERHLMSDLDRRAKTLTAASARRVAIVTAISPRALVDIAFVAYESMKLTRAIAALYGARPGLIGGWKLAGAILGHLAITGGVALGDSVIQQLLGHGLAAKLSARLGEGLVNGLMTVRVGIAAMRVTRPLPFDQLKQPQVIDFATELAKITQGSK